AKIPTSALASDSQARAVVGPAPDPGRVPPLVPLGKRPHRRGVVSRLLLAPQLRPRLRRRGPGRSPLVVLRPPLAGGPAALEPAAAGRGLVPVPARPP